MNIPPDLPSVTVIVVNWNAALLTGACLDSILASDYPGESMKICVVDNGSSDESVAWLQANYPKVMLAALPENLGFGGGVNAGLAATESDLALLVNNDATLEPTAISSFVAAMAASDTKTAAITGLLILANKYRLETDLAATTPALVGHDASAWIPADPADPRAVTLVNSTGNEVTTTGNGRDRDWLTPVTDLAAGTDVFGFCGGAVLLRRDALREVGDFDASLFMYYEDTELSWRLRRAGWSISYSPEAIVYHQHASSSGTTSDVFARYNARNRVIVAVRHAPAAVAWRALARGGYRALRDSFARGTRGRRGRWLLAAFIRLPRELTARRRIDRAAVVSRASLSHYLVAEHVSRGDFDSRS